MSNTKTVMGQASNQYVTPLDITDVFSTYLYTGAGGTGVVVDNGIDLAGEGGLVWIKARNAAEDHVLFDTERGVTKLLESNTTLAEQTNSGTLTNFYSDGFRVDGNGTVGSSLDPYASWTFRKAPKFFDVVTWTGTSGNRTIPHNLQTTVGTIIVKETTTTGNWFVYHKDRPSTSDLLLLNTTGSYPDYNGATNFPTEPTSTDFFVDPNLNGLGTGYVAYVFAHNDGDGGFGPNGDQDIIKCGSYTGNNGLAHHVELGFEPQWLLVKNADLGTPGAWWSVVDDMRGLLANTSIKVLKANESEAEINENGFTPTATGFTVSGNNDFQNNSTNTYIYMAIRRGPLAQPESGTEVFHTQSQSNGDTYSVGFPTDLALINKRSGSSINTLTTSRLTGNDQYLVTSGTNVEATSSNIVTFDLQNSFDQGFSTASPWVGYHWKRAPGYFDSVSWKVDGTGDQTIKHNLGVVPEMVWSKNRNTTSGTYNWWVVAHKDLTGWDSANENDRHVLRLDSSAASAQQGYHRDFTDTSIRMLSVASGGYTTTDNVIAYLFGTVAGVSKVGSYTGTGATLNIDCGFTSGARFVLLKKTSSTGHWILFDTARGIVSGNDPFLQINRTTAEVTAYDVVDPYSSGFTLTSDPTYGLNTSGDSYIFYAIA